MQAITTIGLDIAKSVFQVHGIDGEGKVIIRRQLKRRYVLAFFRKLPPCLVGIEACATSHHWSRELKALGHAVRLMPPAYVKPYVKRQKNDATDAEAICEAVTRANMRFVETKTPEQQSCLMLHRTRHLFIRQQTSVINAIRAHLAEFGILAPVGRQGVAAARSRRRCKRQPGTRGCTGVYRCPWRAAADVEGADPGVRPPDHGLAPIQ
jgi:transposase